MLESFRYPQQDAKAARFLRQLQGVGSETLGADVNRRPFPRAERKFVKPRAICSRCEHFSFLAADVGQPCQTTLRESRCGGCMIAADALRDWSACEWCTGFGWHRGMCCIKCEGSGWTRAATPQRPRAVFS
jgi:hypothetical protein